MGESVAIARAGRRRRRPPRARSSARSCAWPRRARVTDTELLSDKRDSLLLAVSERRHTGRQTYGLAWLGLCQRPAGPRSMWCERDLPGWLSRLDRRRGRWSTATRCPQALKQARLSITHRPTWQFDAALGYTQALRAAGRGQPSQGLQRPGACRAPYAAAVAPAVLRRDAPRASRSRHVQSAVGRAARVDLVDLPPATQRNLELTRRRCAAATSPTLLSLLDTCRTGMGSRALRSGSMHPLRERTVRVQRHVRRSPC